MMPPLRLLKYLFVLPLFLSLVEQAQLAATPIVAFCSALCLSVGVQVNNSSMDGNDP
jgi:hypothetical protein